MKYLKTFEKYDGKVSKSAQKMRPLIDKAIKDGELTRDEYNNILHLASEDNHIDPQEKILLKHLNDLIDGKEIKIIKPEKTNEEIFGFSKEEVAKKGKEKLQKEINTKISAWAGKVEKPGQDVLNKFWADAASDGYKGVVGISKDKKIEYKPAKNVKWAGSASSSIA